jgi:hypothetical protein
MDIEAEVEEAASWRHPTLPMALTKKKLPRCPYR